MRPLSSIWAASIIFFFFFFKQKTAYEMLRSLVGSLTLGLLPVVQRVVAVEVDSTLAAALPETVAARLPAYRGRLQVIAADALALTGVPGAPPTAVVANLPYNIAVPVLLRVLEHLPTITHGLV